MAIKINNTKIAIVLITLSCLLGAFFVFRIHLLDIFYSVKNPEEVDFVKTSIIAISVEDKNYINKAFLPQSFLLKNKSSIENCVKLLKPSPCNSFSVVEVQFSEEEQKQIAFVMAQCTFNSDYMIDFKLTKIEGDYLIELIKFSTPWRFERGFPAEL